MVELAPAEGGNGFDMFLHHKSRDKVSYRWSFKDWALSSPFVGGSWASIEGNAADIMA